MTTYICQSTVPKANLIIPNTSIKIVSYVNLASRSTYGQLAPQNIPYPPRNT